MAENKGKKYITAIIIPLLLILAAAFFTAIDSAHRKNRCVAERIRSGYIDAEAVYNSTQNYGIVKKEIAEYASRINKELALKLAREQDEAKKTLMKQQAEMEIKFYADTLLQDIEKDIDNAIDEVAEIKDLKRVYINGRIRQNGKNLTQDVIKELNMTALQRLSGYFEHKSDEQSMQGQKYEKQFNFDSYQMAGVPEQEMPKEAFGGLAGVNNKSIIIADTQMRYRKGKERFTWKQAITKGAEEKVLVTKKSPKRYKQREKYENVSKFELPSGKTKMITEGCRYALSSGIAFLQARNLALMQMQMSSQNTAKRIAKLKTVAQQHKVENSVVVKTEGMLALRPSRITLVQVAMLLNTATDKAHTDMVLFEEYAPILMQNIQNSLLDIYAKCGKMWHNTVASVQAKTAKTEQLSKAITEVTTEDVDAKQQDIKAEEIKEVKSVKETRAPQPVTNRQTKETQPKPPTAGQKPAESQQETQVEKSVAKLAPATAARPIQIQVAACLNKGGAERAVKNLCEKHIPAQLVGAEKSGKQWWCVRVMAANSTQAKTYKQKLATLGYCAVIMHQRDTKR